MNTLMRSALLTLLAVGLLSCDARTARTDTGGVLLAVSAFSGLPSVFSMNHPGTGDVNGDGKPDLVVVSSVTIRSIVSDPSGTTSDLMSVELKSYQVVYRRLDGGTLTPDTLVDSLAGQLLAPGGTATLSNLPLLESAQLSTRPLRDLLFSNGGQEQGTGRTVIRLGMTVTFFGRTVAGKDVSTEPQELTMDIIQ